MSSQKMACFKCKYFCVTGTGTIQKAAGLFSLPCLAQRLPPPGLGVGKRRVRFSLKPGGCPLSKFSGHLAILVCVLKRKTDKLYMAGNIGVFLKRMYTFFGLQELSSESSLTLEGRGWVRRLRFSYRKRCRE